MADDDRRTLAEGAARQLANATKTRAQWGGISPRWLIPFLPWTPVEAGIYRLNRVKETRGATSASSADVECSPPRDRDADLPETFVDYEENPQEYFLNAVTTVLDVQTRVSDLYGHPFDQIQRAASPPDREGEGASGERAHQQQGVWTARQHGEVHAHQDARRLADAGRSRRAYCLRCGRSRYARGRRRDSSPPCSESRRDAASADSEADDAGDCGG